MAFPTILVHSSGSDTQASGAGPTTALFGTTDASFSGATVTLTAATDLTNVATDGSHVLYLLTSTGVRFFKITAKAGSGGATPTVEVTPNPAGTSTARTWAIGGKRAAIGSASTKLLFDNGGAAGDVMPGWIVEMQSGHTETITAQYDMRRAGDTTSGPVILRGATGGTMPVVTFNNNGLGFVPRADFNQIYDFDLRNTNATKTASVAIDGLVVGSTGLVVSGMRIRDSTDKFWKPVRISNGTQLVDSEIAYAASFGVDIGASNGFKVRNNFIHHCTGIAVSLSGDNVGGDFSGNIVYANTTHGMLFDSTGVNSNRAVVISHNIFDSNGGDGLRSAQASMAVAVTEYLNNIFSNNGGWGVNFTTATAALFAAHRTMFLGNHTYLNTSGDCNITGLLVGDANLNPTYTNAAAGDFSIGTNLKAKGYPLAGTLYVGKTSTTYSYVDPGAAQRQEAGGGSGGVIGGPNMRAGMMG